MTALMIVLCSIVYLTLAFVHASAWNAYSGWFKKGTWQGVGYPSDYVAAAGVSLLSLVWPVTLVVVLVAYSGIFLGSRVAPASLKLANFFRSIKEEKALRQ